MALTAVAPAARAVNTVTATTAGFADQTADFYAVAFTSGQSGDWVSSVKFTLPFGFFDFDGQTSYANATAPVLHTPSLAGLTAGDIQFAFAGVNPTDLTVVFAPGSFAVGDSFRFAADVDEMGSKLGGVFGAGATLSVTFGSGLEGSAPFVTDTSVVSSVSVTATAVQEGSPLALLSCAAAATAAVRTRRRRWRQGAGAQPAATAGGVQRMT